MFEITKHSRAPRERPSGPLRILLIALAFSAASAFCSEGSTSDTGASVVAAGASKVEADLRLQQGSDQSDLRQYGQATETLQQALALYREIGDRAGEAKALKNLGNIHQALADYEQAIVYQQGALEIARAVGDKQLHCAALINLGSAYKARGQMDEALLRYRESLILARQAGLKKLQAISAAGLGIGLYKSNKPAEAVSYLESGLSLAHETGQRGIAAAASVYLGRTHEALGNLPNAESAYQDALSLAKNLGNRPGTLGILLGLASVHHQKREFAGAIRYAGTALGEAKALELPSEAIAALGQLAVSYIALGDNEKALELGLGQLAIAQQLDDLGQQGIALETVGVAYLTLSNYLDAIGALSRMLSIGRELSDSVMEGKALRNLGQAYLSLGEIDTASEHFHEQLARSRAAGNREQVFDALQNLGDLQVQLTEFAEAVDFYERSLRVARRLDDKKWSIQALQRLGNAYHYLENNETALEYAQESLAQARITGSKWDEWKALQILGRAYAQMGDEKAVEHLQELVAISADLNVQAEHLALIELGGVHLLLGNQERGIAVLRQSLTLSRQNGDAESEATALEMLGNAFVAGGDLRLAEKALRDAIDVADSIRAQLDSHDVFKVSIFERQAAAYRQLQKVLILLDKPEQALEIAERGRARAFAELLSKRLVLGAPEQIPAAPDVAQIRRLAAERNTTLVEYSVLEEDSILLAWVVEPNGRITIRQTDLGSLLPRYQDSLGKLVNEGRQHLGIRGIGALSDADAAKAPKPSLASARQPDPAQGIGAETASLPDGHDDEPLNQFHQLLIDPISDLLPSDPDAEIVFIPQGSLFLVPFAALQGNDGKFLVEKHAIVTAPSIQVLALTGQGWRHPEQRLQAGESPRQLFSNGLVVGNPSMPSLPGWSEPLPPLPAAEVEANGVALLLGARAVTGAQATKAKVVRQMGSAQLIHFATHGILDDKRGFGSAVALAPSETDAGLLSAEEISEMRLSARLVVLSACNTGRGRITGDGVIGLSRSFISAGAPSVMVSLWSIPDAPTALLMTEFYKNLAENLSTAAALRQAMLSTMREHPDPLNWAAFTLIGESRPMVP